MQRKEIVLKYLPRKIKELREAKGLLQRELAKQLGIEQSTLSGWESGNRSPSAAMLEKLADIFGCSIDNLFGRGGDEG